MIQLMLITADPAVAAFAAAHGVDRIFVDLELLGKAERQGHLDTVISRHTLSDLAKVRAAIPGHPLLVRINPFHAGTFREVEEVLELGVDWIMLPMFRTAEEVRAVSQAVRGRARVIPLLETPQAMARLPEVLTHGGLDELYIGLNDLHLGMGLDFLFEPLAGGLVDHMVRQLHAAGIPFGFGGVGRLDGAPLPGAQVLAEHCRLGSRSVILSRSFHKGSRTLQDFEDTADLATEIARFRALEQEYKMRSPGHAEQDRRRTWELIHQIAREKRTSAAP